MTEEIGSIISQNVSKVAMYPSVREELVKMQRTMAESADVVMDGRDAEPLFFPMQSVRFWCFLKRAYRLPELQKKGYEQDYASIKEELAQRDYLDEHRSSSPLKPAQDAVIVDTTTMSPDEVMAEVLAIYQRKIAQKHTMG